MLAETTWPEAVILIAVLAAVACILDSYWSNKKR